MGFFSAECSTCHCSILAPYALGEDLDPRLAAVTAIAPNGSIVHGHYDGYGTIEGPGWSVADLFGDATVFHTACWDAAGQPLAYRGPSASAHDQGYFIDVERYRDWRPAAG